ncbi:MAG: YkgJ family cysteine cluster protein [bacterium]
MKIKSENVHEALIQDNPCFGCTECCEYVAVEIDKPVSLADFENIRWFILHKNVWIYIDDSNDWYLQFDSPCEKLDSSGLCAHYPLRPEICRKYSAEECTHNSKAGDPHKVTIKCEKDLDNYLIKNRPVMRRRLAEKLKPNGSK